jgi:hypothetical protein
MKHNFIVMIMMALWLTACGGSAAPDGALTAEQVQLDPEEEWRIVYSQTVMLEAACSMLYGTNFDYNFGEISLERVRTELDAEAGFVQASQDELATLSAPSEAVAPYLAELESAILGIQPVLTLGEAAVIEDDYDLWEGVRQTCDTLFNLQEQILAAASAAGLTQAMLDEFELDAGEAVLVVYESTDWGRTAADAPVATNTAVSSAPTQAAGGSAGDQESLKTVWRPAYNLGALLFETCTLVYQTHADFSQGEIGTDRAQDELEAESDSVEYVLNSITATSPESDDIAAYLLQTEAQATALTAWLGSQDNGLGTPQALDGIGHTCESLQNIMNSIFTQAQAAGLSRESLNELDEEMRPMIDDLYNQTWYGR